MSLPNFSTVRRARGSSLNGFTVLETTVAGALLMLFLSSMFLMSSTVMRMLRSGSETASASQALQTRVEQIRLSNWAQITSPGYVQTSVLGTPTDASVNLPGLREIIEASPYGLSNKNGAPAFRLERNSQGQVSASQGAGTGVNLSNEDMVRFTVTIIWPGWGGRERERSLMTVISPWGVSR